jgi:hypothetical protein
MFHNQFSSMAAHDDPRTQPRQVRSPLPPLRIGVGLDWLVSVHPYSVAPHDYLADRLLSSSFPRGIAFVALAVPGFLFLLCGLSARSTKKHGGGKF